MKLAERHPLLLIIGVWLLLRVIFFEGLFGFDDLSHVNFALHPDHLPRNHWETRLLYNGLLALSVHTLGFAEWVLALPGLLGSLVFTLATWWVTRRLVSAEAGFLAGIFASLLVLDVTLSTYPAASSLANGFAALGTATLLIAGTRRGLLAAAGAILGISVWTHISMIFYVGILAGATALAGWPRLDWRRAISICAVSALAFLVCELIAFWWLTGNPLYEFTIISKTHMFNQQFAVPLRLPSGKINPSWMLWPLWNLVFSKAFGFFIAVPLAITAFLRRSLEPALRLAPLTILLYWAWICYGSQHPLKYLPLDHDTRYWYPMALPACLLAAALISRVAGAAKRRTFSALLILPNCFLLLMSGSWGQNVEISRELLQYANAHWGTFFVTDRYTYDEMYILLGARPPQNIGLIGDTTTAFYHPDAAARRAADDPHLQVLYNPLQEWRADFETFRKEIDGMERQNISQGRYRMLAYLLPPSMRNRYPLLLRKPPAQLATRCSFGTDQLAPAFRVKLRSSVIEPWFRYAHQPAHRILGGAGPQTKILQDRTEGDRQVMPTYSIFPLLRAFNYSSECTSG